MYVLLSFSCYIIAFEIKITIEQHMTACTELFYLSVFLISLCTNSVLTYTCSMKCFKYVEK